MDSKIFQFLEDIIKKSKSRGASAADAILINSNSSNVSVRQSKLEKTERSDSRDLGLRVMVGQKQSIASVSYSAQTDIDALVERAVEMAKLSPDDPYCGLPDLSDSLHGLHRFDNADPSDVSEAELENWARTAESNALEVSGITNTEGGDASTSRSEVYLVNSNGLTGHYSQSSFSISASVIAGRGDAMERDYDYTVAAFRDDLADPAAIGRKAGERAVKRLNPRKIKTASVPVVFDPRVARGLIGSFAGAINGSAIARGTSFLKSKMGARIFKPGMTITDDPLRRRALRSRPFDAEGISTVRRNFIEDGVLQSWILDCRSARQLKLQSTGHASRGVSSPPHPSATNFFLAAGSATPDQLIADIADGFYVTETMGMGVNMITGDFSQGASGFWIENGKIAYPVSEATIAGHMLEMFSNLTPANDLEFKYGVDSPTVMIDQMTVAGR